MRQPEQHLLEISERVEAGRAAEVRGHDDIAEAEQGVVGPARLVVREIEREAAQPPGGERLDQRRAVDEPMKSESSGWFFSSINDTRAMGFL